MTLTPEAMTLIRVALRTASAIVRDSHIRGEFDQALQVLIFEQDGIEWARCTTHSCGHIDALEDMTHYPESDETLCDVCRDEMFGDPYRKPRAV